MTTSQKQFKNLLAWEAFLHTARTGNITLTAQVLNIDGSAVSRLIKGLEEELEQPLFDRSSRPFSLTPRGKRLREEVEPLVTGFEALISRRFEEPKQIIRVSAPADLSRDIIPEQLMNYTIEHPNVQFELSSLGSASEVLAGTVDAALTQHRPSNNANLTLRPCITASSPVLATPEYIDREASQIFVITRDCCRKADCIPLLQFFTAAENLQNYCVGRMSLLPTISTV